jgi:REP element-mobilizing transposase RayT
MTMAREQLVDSSLTPFYHCISRCVRRAFLCGEGCEDRKRWIETRLQKLSEIFAVGVCGFAVMDSHFHVVLQLNDAVAAGWSEEEVVRRWGRLFPPRGKDRQPLGVSDAWVEQRLKDTAWVATARERLNSLGWFMKCVKEPLARLANKQDDCRGTFWEARYKSIAILDEEALLTTLAYVDLNPLAAGITKTLEESPHTSVKSRIDHCREQGTLEQVVNQPKDRTKHREAQEDESFWLVPLQDRREADGRRAGISPGINLASYLRLLDWSSRLIRRGKARVPKEVAEILSRLDSSAGLWQERLEKLTAIERTFGVVFATRAVEIARFATARSVTKLSNLNGCARRV